MTHDLDIFESGKKLGLNGLNVEHTTLLYNYSSHILIFYFKFAPNIPVHTKLSILYIVYYYFNYLCLVLSLPFCRTVELLSPNAMYVQTYLAIKLILINANSRWMDGGMDR